MAVRRMFSKNVMWEDEFLALPHECQLLYVNLSLEADDDGFLKGKNRIMDMLGLGEEHFAALVRAGYIITFPSGAAVLTHWLVNNRIRRDRYTPTKYRAELALLSCVPETGYVLKTDLPDAPACGNVQPEPAATNEPAVPSAPCADAPGLPLNDGAEHTVSQAEVDEWRRLYPAVDVLQELRNMRGWLLADPAKRKTAAGIVRFINRWLANAQNGAHGAGGQKEPAAAPPQPPASYDLDRFEQRMNTTVPKLKKKTPRG